jgi:hypothetical protein
LRLLKERIASRIAFDEKKIAIASAATILAIAAIWYAWKISSFSSVSEPDAKWWVHASELVLLGSTVLLTVGLFGEWPDSESWKKRLLYKVSKAAVIIGVAGELLADGGVFQAGDRLQELEEKEISAATTSANSAKERAAQLTKDAEVLKGSNLKLQRDLESERIERIKMEEKFGARRFPDGQIDAIKQAFNGVRMRAYVRCIDEVEACVAANNFATVLRDAGLDVPPIEGVGLTLPPSVGIEVYDPAGEQGLFAKTVLNALADIRGARFRSGPFVIAGVPLDPANPAMIVRMKIP